MTQHPRSLTDAEMDTTFVSARGVAKLVVEHANEMAQLRDLIAAQCRLILNQHALLERQQRMLEAPREQEHERTQIVH